MLNLAGRLHMLHGHVVGATMVHVACVTTGQATLGRVTSVSRRRIL